VFVETTYLCCLTAAVPVGFVIPTMHHPSAFTSVSPPSPSSDPDPFHKAIELIAVFVCGIEFGSIRSSHEFASTDPTSKIAPSDVVFRRTIASTVPGPNAKFIEPIEHVITWLLVATVRAIRTSSSRR
jgi:hypothetical protein